MHTLLLEFGIPCVFVDTSSITQTGFSGKDALDCLRPLITTGGRGIVFLDEIDKRLCPTYSSYGDNVNAQIQADLLTIIEGNDNLSIGDERISTYFTMFVGLGAFTDMERKRDVVKHKLGFGFSESEESVGEDSLIEDIMSYGGRSELVGRFSSICELKPLNREDKEKILNKYCLKYKHIIKMPIVIHPLQADVIINGNDSLGCRGIEKRLLQRIKNVMYEVPEINNKKDKYVYINADGSYEFRLQETVDTDKKNGSNDACKVS